MCITEFDEKTFVDGIKEEGREEGIKEVRKEGRDQNTRQGKDLSNASKGKVT